MREGCKGNRRESVPGHSRVSKTIPSNERGMQRQSQRKRSWALAGIENDTQQWWRRQKEQQKKAHTLAGIENDT